MSPLNSETSIENLPPAWYYGLCPLVAVTLSAGVSLYLSVALLLLVLGCNLLGLGLRATLPVSMRQRWQLPLWFVISSAMCAIVVTLFIAWQPQWAERGGIFLPLLVTNGVVVGCVAMLEENTPVGKVFSQTAKQAVILAFSLACLGLLREWLAFGSSYATITPPATSMIALPDWPLHLQSNKTVGIPLFTSAAGGFFTVALLMAVWQGWRSRYEQQDYQRGRLPAVAPALYNESIKS